MLNKLARAENKFSALVERLLEILAVAAGAGIIIFLTWEIVSRYLFAISTPWHDEITAACVAYMGFLLLGPLWKRDQHIRIDALYRRFEGKRLWWIELFFQLVGIFFCALLVWCDIQLISVEWGVYYPSTLAQWPLYWIHVVLHIGIFCFVFFIIERLVKHCLSYNRRIEQ
ncbi:MAG: TRAP transporter small permease [Chloroflexota bacterium]|nr:TRAP transporter small permease [Chloroflexota bacterium]